jgi:hypothetical protein
MSGSGSFTHGESVTVTAPVFCPVTTPEVESVCIDRILIEFDRREDSLNVHRETGGKIRGEMAQTSNGV